MRDTLRRDPFWTGGQKVPWMDLRAGRGKKNIKKYSCHQVGETGYKGQETRNLGNFPTRLISYARCRQQEAGGHYGSC